MSMFEKAAQKALREQYRAALIAAGDSEHDADFHLSTAYVVVKFDNGLFLNIRKPAIEKRFCFGYSLSAHDSESYDRAGDMAEKAEQDTQYFMAENLRDLKGSLEKCLDTRFPMVFAHRYRHDCMIDVLYFPFLPDDWDDTSKYPQLSNTDRALLVEGYKKAIVLHTKRLQTYLKRYGLSKVRTWTYWQDA